jgi:hypothetical protein
MFRTEELFPSSGAIVRKRLLNSAWYKERVTIFIVSEFYSLFYKPVIVPPDNIKLSRQRYILQILRFINMHHQQVISKICFSCRAYRWVQVLQF